MVQTAPAEFLQFAQELRPRIDAYLQRYTQFPPGCPDVLANAIRYSLLAPGKRLRPLLVLLSAESCGSDLEPAMPAACAVEMIHTYSLIHDDLPAMDDDDLRRGQPSCHIKFGEAMAILAGDALLAQAFEVLSRDVQPPEIAAQCCAELAHASGSSELVGGQVDDLAAEFSDFGIADLENIHRRKTGALFRVSLRLGAIVAAAEDRQLSALDDYAKNLGLAFQITDDLLDLKGNEQTMGKRIGKDSDRGKLTFPAVLGVNESRSRARHLLESACQALTSFGAAGGRLEALARYILERNQ